MNFLSEQSGTAMTEAVIVLPVFVILFSGTLALHGIYGSRLEAQFTASGMVMAAASSGDCGDQSLDLAKVPGAEQAEPVARRESDMLSRLGAANPMVVAHSRTSAEGGTEVFGQSARVEGSRVMACDMKPQDGLMELITEMAGDLLGVADE